MRRRLFITALLFGIGAAAGAPAADRLEPVVAEAFYPEGPLWVGGRLLYAEMSRGRLMAWDGKANREFARLPKCGPTSIAPAGGAFIVTCHLADKLLRVSAEGKVLWIIDRDSEGRRFVLPNDSTSDGRGGVWFSSAGEFDPGAPATGTIYHLAADGRLRPIVDSIRYANGVTRSADGKRLLVSEHLGRRVLSFRIGADAALDDRRVFFDLEDAPRPMESDRLAGPDGIEVARDGTVYVAEYGAARVLVLEPDGRYRRSIDVPGKYVTNVALDERQRFLYITAPASNSQPPYRGAVWRIAVPLE